MKSPQTTEPSIHATVFDDQVYIISYHVEHDAEGDFVTILEVTNPDGSTIVAKDALIEAATREIKSEMEAFAV